MYYYSCFTGETLELRRTNVLKLHDRRDTMAESSLRINLLCHHLFKISRLLRITKLMPNTYIICLHTIKSNPQFLPRN
eukprot:CCRYP_010162-RA/>CCRYP_010162-RA protein AED:0.31 eAED:0.31 QI:203/1/0.5/1/0/0/2/0/77